MMINRGYKIQVDFTTEHLKSKYLSSSNFNGHVYLKKILMSKIQLKKKHIT